MHTGSVAKHADALASGLDRGLSPLGLLILLFGFVFIARAANAETKSSAVLSGEPNSETIAPSEPRVPRPEGNEPRPEEREPRDDNGEQPGDDSGRASPDDGLSPEEREPRDDNGEQPGDDSERASPVDGLSPEERARLDAALGADRHAESSDAGSGDPAPSELGASGPPTFGRRLQNALNPEISLLLDVAASYFSDEPRTLGAHDPQRTGFTFQQLELHLGASVDPYFRLDANLVFMPTGVEVEEAYATTLGVPGGFQFRVGQFLSRFGRMNATHPHAWHFVEQPLVLGKFFGGDGNRGIGGEISWLTPLPWYVELVASVQEAEGSCCMRSYFGAQRPRIRSVADFAYTLALKQFFAFGPDWGLNWGLSAQFGPTVTGNRNRAEIYGTDLYLRYRPLTGTRSSSVSLTIEVLHRRRQVPGDILTDTGGYGQLVWRINKRWETGARYELVTGLDDDPLDPEWTALRDRSSLQATFYPSHFSRIRLQSGVDRAAWEATPLGWSATLNLELLIGAHGAHDY